MAAANIIFPNLRAEMARRNLSIQDVAKAIKTGRDTAGAKLSGKRPIHLDEAITITDTFSRTKMCDIYLKKMKKQYIKKRW